MTNVVFLMNFYFRASVKKHDCDSLSVRWIKRHTLRREYIQKQVLFSLSVTFLFIRRYNTILQNSLVRNELLLDFHRLLKSKCIVMHLVFIRYANPMHIHDLCLQQMLYSECLVMRQVFFGSSIILVVHQVFISSSIQKICLCNRSSLDLQIRIHSNALRLQQIYQSEYISYVLNHRFALLFYLLFS